MSFLSNIGNALQAAGGSDSNLQQQKLAFEKWQTQQQLQSKMLESGFIPVSDKDVTSQDTTAKLNGQTYKLDQNLRMMSSPMGQMMYMASPAGQAMMAKSMGGGFPQGQVQPGGITMPSVQMPNMGMPGQQQMSPNVQNPAMMPNINNYPNPSMMMKFPGTEVDPRYTAGLGISTKGAEEQQSNTIDASKSVARDTATFDMMYGIMNDLMDTYDKADKSGVAGDKYRAAWGQFVASGNLPKEISSALPQDAMESVGNFQAKRNELMTRMQPLMSEQFGKDGSNRIMESLLNLSQKELPELKDPRSTAVGKSIGTMKNLYRFAKGSADYAQKVGVTPSVIANGKDSDIQDYIQKVLSSKSGSLTPEENQYFDSLRSKFIKGSSSNNSPFQVGQQYNGHKILSVEKVK